MTKDPRQAEGERLTNKLEQLRQELRERRQVEKAAGHPAEQPGDALLLRPAGELLADLDANGWMGEPGPSVPALGP